MAEIICIECKTSVPGTSEYCPECGYPFDLAPEEQNNAIASDAGSRDVEANTSSQLDVILESLDSVRLEMAELKRVVSGVQQDDHSHSMISADATQKVLTDIAAKLDSLAAVKYSKETEDPSDATKKTKKNLLAAFYKTLNSPNSMFEYMFYICVVQIVFVIVNLFLVTYIVTLVRP
jgi:hypothetical protein